jgi:putative transposase
MGRYNPQIHHRRSIRLQGWDYRQSGHYFVTICVQYRECLFGQIEHGKFYPNQFGKIVSESLNSGFLSTSKQGHEVITPEPNITIFPWVVMPNHAHFILKIGDQNQQGISLGEWIRQFKYNTTCQINALRNTPGVRVWQRNYYEHIIQNESAYEMICNYIRDNPSRWQIDQLHPNNPSKW